MAVAVAQQESGWRPRATAPASEGSIGLMQVKPGTQKDIERWLAIAHEPQGGYDPEYSMLLGETYLAYQRQRYGSWDKAIYAYNAGSVPGLAKHQAFAQKYREQVKERFKTLWGYYPDEASVAGAAEPPANVDFTTMDLLILGGVAYATYLIVRALHK